MLASGHMIKMMTWYIETGKLLATNPSEPYK